MKIGLPIENLHAIEHIYTELQLTEVNWLVGGSCGLVLQDVVIDKSPRDLDIYVDAKDAEVVYEALQAYATDQLVNSQTGIYISLLSHFLIHKVPVEVVGGFEVHAEQSHYRIEVSDLLKTYEVTYEANNCRFGLMPLAHELVFNILRQRPDRYQAIAEKMRTNKAVYLIPLNKILERNSFSVDFHNRLNELL
ncbi:hypothetical protein EHS13_19390 [Paenibacillus psychroresistens]|uniref:Nucleotidyltransferase family protein n=1 Tax=Paenibacillus psychroresistens TaxID=1778678 RepID=A0A6B8RMB1_9BACL|nr:hypothetical protein [Paenibacillus psychroresistens]QGQ96894.1 hypothetical protein EHS13_19390 [Paenibacillus psychroresistens]